MSRAPIRPRRGRLAAVVAALLLLLAALAPTAQAKPRVVALTPFTANTLAILGVRPLAVGQTVGEGATASDGAVPGPLETAPGSDARLVYSFSFGLKPGSWYDPAGGSAGLLASGTVRFRYSGHGIDISVRDPEIELKGGASRAIFAFSGGDCTQIAPVRGVMLDLSPGSPAVSGAARDYGAIPATIADAGATMFSGCYLPGDPWGSFAVAFETAP